MIIEIFPQVRETQTHRSQTQRLDDVLVQIDTYTNRFDGAWYLDLFDDEGVPIVQGLALVTQVDLLYPYRANAGVPPGILFVASKNREFSDPGLESFNDKDHALYYQEAADAPTTA